MSKYKVHNGTLFSYSAGVLCGVLVKEKVMRKLAKAQARHLQEVKNILTDNKESVYPSMWTLHYPEGAQTVVTYIDKSDTVDRAIESAVTECGPVKKSLVFVAGSMNEAKAMAEAHHLDTMESVS